MKTAIFTPISYTGGRKAPLYNVVLMGKCLNLALKDYVPIIDAGWLFPEEEKDGKKVLKASISEVKKINPKILFVMTSHLLIPFVIEFIKEYKRMNPDTIIILGGWAIGHFADNLLKYLPDLDIIMRAEEEITSVELIKCLLKKDNLNKVKNISFRGGKKIIHTLSKNTDYSLDKLPYIDYDQVLYCPSKNLKNVGLRFQTGCLGKCTFCTLPKNYSAKSPQAAVNEMLHLYKKYGETKFNIIDYNLTMNHDWMNKFCKALKKTAVDFAWWGLSRIDTCSKEILKKMAKSGCVYLDFGVETLNPKSLLFLNKTSDPVNYIASAKKIPLEMIKTRVLASFSLIAGLPEENLKEMEITADYADWLKKLGFYTSIEPLYVGPGSHLWSLYLKKQIKIAKISNDLITKKDPKKNCSPAYFIEKYKHIPWIGFTDFMVKHNFLPQKKVENFMIKRYYSENPDVYITNLSTVISYPEKSRGEKITLSHPAAKLTIRGALKSIKTFEPHISIKIYLNNKLLGKIRMINDLKFREYSINFKKIIFEGTYFLNIEPNNNDNDLYIDWVKMEREKPLWWT